MKKKHWNVSMNIFHQEEYKLDLFNFKYYIYTKRYDTN